MAEVDIKYDGSSIATMNASGTKTLLTANKYCSANIQVEYNRPSDSGDMAGYYVVPVWVAVQDGIRVGYIDRAISEIVEAHNNGRTLLAQYANTDEFYQAAVYYDSDIDEWIFSTTVQDQVFGDELDNHYIPTGIRLTFLSSDATYYITEERIYWFTADAADRTEAQPSDVPAGKVFFNSSGAHLGTAT